VIKKPGREVLLLAPLLPSPQRIVVMRDDMWRRCFKLERTQSDLVIASTLRHFFASPSCRPSQATFPTFAWRPGRVSPIQKPAQLSVLLDTVEPIEGPLLAQSGHLLNTPTSTKREKDDLLRLFDHYPERRHYRAGWRHSARRAGGACRP